jgi:hypothetical protein
MLSSVALVRTGVSEVHSTSIIMVTRIGELGTTLDVDDGDKTSLLTRATQCNIPEDGILHIPTCQKVLQILIEINKNLLIIIHISSGIQSASYPISIQG